MGDNEVVSGLLKGWDVVGNFALTQEVYQAMNAKLPTAGNLVQNRQLSVVSAMYDHDDITAVMVIYSVEGFGACATLFRAGREIIFSQRSEYNTLKKAASAGGRTYLGSI